MPRSGGAKAKTKRAAAVEPVTVIEAVKGFDRDLKCRGFVFEVGQTYTVEGEISVCENGFHACENPFDTLDYYSMVDGSRYAVVEQSGALSRHDEDSKIAAATITIKAELRLPDFIQRCVTWIVGHAKTNLATGDSGHAAATGDRGHAAATGERGHAAATGYRGRAAATGDGGHAAATGGNGHAAATGERGHAAATGGGGHAAATGDSGHAAATGDRGHAAATGGGGHAAATGKFGISASLGPDGTAMAGEDGWLVLAAWQWSGVTHRQELLAVRSAKVGGPEGVKANVRYRLGADGECIETEA